MVIVLSSDNQACCNGYLETLVWSFPPTWEAVQLTLGGCLELSVPGAEPYRFGRATIAVAAEQDLAISHLSSDADSMPLYHKVMTQGSRLQAQPANLSLKAEQAKVRSGVESRQVW